MRDEQLTQILDLVGKVNSAAEAWRMKMRFNLEVQTVVNRDEVNGTEYQEPIVMLVFMCWHRKEADEFTASDIANARGVESPYIPTITLPASNINAICFMLESVKAKLAQYQPTREDWLLAENDEFEDQ
jgi:hypothetical protein